MATPVTFNGVAYSIPAYGDVGYAQGPGNLSSYLIALATGTLQTVGGLFSLTAQANFGPNFGLTALDFISVSALPATAGVLRLAKADVIDWRNNANTLNLPLGINGSDQLTFNGVVINTSTASGVVSTGTAGRLTLYPATGTTVDDVYVQNSQNIDILIATQAARSVGLEYTIPNPGNAVAAATFSLLELAQTFTAIKTFSAGAGAVTLSGSTIAMGGGAISASGNITFSPTTAGIVGTTTNDAAPAGNVGEYIQSLATGVSFGANGVAADATTISLTAGDWDVTICGNVSGTAVITGNMLVGISVTAGNSLAGLVTGVNQWIIGVVGLSTIPNYCVANYRISTSSTITVRMKTYADYSGTAPTTTGRLSARRLR